MTTFKRDFSQPIRNLDGDPIRVGGTPAAFGAAIKEVLDAEWDPAVKELLEQRFEEAFNKHCGKPLTLGRAASNGLTAGYKDETPADDDRIKRLGIALMVHNGGIVEIDPTQREKIKRYIGKFYGDALIAPICWDLLEKAPAPAEAAPALPETAPAGQ